MIYRTTDLTKWGTGKGANLTAPEIDGNFWELTARLVSVETNPRLPAQISNIQVIGTQMTIFLSNGTVFGPYTLPSALLHWRGDWAPATAYSELDLVVVPDSGLYLVLRSHTSAATFSATAVNASGLPLYRWLMATSRKEYDVGFFHPSRIGSAGNYLFQFIAPRSFTLPSLLAGSRFRLHRAPSAILTLPVLKNGSALGSIRFNPAVSGGTVPERIDWPGNVAVRFDAGDLLQVQEPTTTDATAEGLIATFAGTTV